MVFLMHQENTHANKINELLQNASLQQEFGVAAREKAI
jgi:hypothetical protein